MQAAPNSPRPPSLPSSTSRTDPELTNAPPPPTKTAPTTTTPAPAPAISTDPSFRTAPEDPSQATHPSTPPIPKETEQSQVQSQEKDPNTTSSETLPPIPANFAPYFTLLTSTTTLTSSTQPQTLTHHPTVRYIFADDPLDASPITDAALELLSPTPADPTQDPDPNPNPTSLSREDQEQSEDDNDPDAKHHPTNPKPQTHNDKNNKRERFILLTLDSTATKVLTAQSMSPDWAVTGAEVGTAPTWEGDGAAAAAAGVGAEGKGGGMMLKVEGVEAWGGDEIVASGDSEGEEEEEEEKEEEGRGFEELVEEFERRMGELRRVVDRGGGGDREGGKVMERGER